MKRMSMSILLPLVAAAYRSTAGTQFDVGQLTMSREQIIANWRSRTSVNHPTAHRCSGVAAIRRAARKQRNRARHRLACKKARA